MRLAVSIWEDRIAPVMDASCTLILYDIKRGAATHHAQLSLADMEPMTRIRAISDHGVELLLCGAVSREYYEALLAANVNVTAFIAGTVKEVLKAYLAKELRDSRYLMPGCQERQRRNRCRNKV
jgi:predicted Fe-Mo cluster-binding NifX family protein